MWIWIDPPGEMPGWLHELADPDDLPALLAGYPIPADNAARQEAYDRDHAGQSAAQYQAGRDFWGVTALGQLPGDLPPDIIRVGPATIIEGAR